MIIKPMLAASKFDPNKIQFPVVVQPKYDGVRMLVKDGVALSRKLEPFKNRMLQKHVEANAERYEGLDGELLTGDVAKCTSNKVTSIVNSYDSSISDLYYVVYDKWNRTGGYFCIDAYYEDENIVYDEEYLNNNLQYIIHSALFGENRAYRGQDKVSFVATHAWVHSHKCHTLEQINMIEKHNVVEWGYEGSIVRPICHPYKFGRSTPSQGLIKLKRFHDMEVRIVGFKQKMRNENEATIDNTGHQKRSTHQENMKPTNMLGSFECILDNGIEVNVGTGFTDDQRKEYWLDRYAFVREETMITIKYQSLSDDGVPLFPVFVRFRED